MAEKRVEGKIERQKPKIREHVKGVKFHTLAPGITTHPFVRSGRPCLAGTTIMVENIASLYKSHHMDAQEIADNLWLELDVVRKALDYYADNKQYIDFCNQLNNIHGTLMRESPYGDWTRELLSRRDALPKDFFAVEEAGH